MLHGQAQGPHPVLQAGQACREEPLALTQHFLPPSTQLLLLLCLCLLPWLSRSRAVSQRSSQRTHGGAREGGTEMEWRSGEDTARLSAKGNDWAKAQLSCWKPAVHHQPTHEMCGESLASQPQHEVCCSLSFFSLTFLFLPLPLILLPYV